MRLRDMLSERILFGMTAMVCSLTVAVLILTGYASAKGVSDTMQGVIMTGFMGWGLLVMQSSFRTDKIDRQNAETMATQASALSAAVPSTPTPVAVVNPVTDPVPVAPQEPQ